MIIALFLVVQYVIRSHPTSQYLKVHEVVWHQVLSVLGTHEVWQISYLLSESSLLPQQNPSFWGL